MSDESGSGEGQANTNTGDGGDQQTGATDGQQQQASGGDNSTDTGTPGEGQQQTEGQQQAGGDEGDKGGDGDGESSGVPETYEFTMPEGMEMDQGLADAVTPLFRELELNQEQADKLVGVYAQHLQSMDQANIEAYNQQLEDWSTELQNDADFGGDNFEENSAIARTAMEKLGSPELIEALEATGFGSNPAMVKFAHKVGVLLREDQPGSGNQNTEGKDRLARLYPNESQAS